MAHPFRTSRPTVRRRRGGIALFDDTIELTGNTDAYFDRCRRLLECSEMLVQLQTRTHTVSVWGRGLQASDYSLHGLHIQGEIATIEFDGGLQ